MITERVMMVDRRDQAEWLVQDSWPFFCVNVKDRKAAIFNWLQDSTAGRVVISGDGVLPDEKGSPYTIWACYENIQKNIYKIYFEDETSAMMFKLAWGGAI
jgi:hypothetical protein